MLISFAYTCFQLLIDLKKLKGLLETDDSNHPICTLCVKTNETYQIRSYPFAEALFPHIERIFSALKTHTSKYFNKIWETNISKYQCEEQLSFSDVINLIWIPTIDHCQSTLKKLKTWEMKLVDIDEEFKGDYSSEGALLSDLQSISQVVGIEGVDAESLEKISTRMWQYWEVCSYYEPAKALISVKDRLKLTGDFRIVEKVADEMVS